jgi:hypothetical protein
MGLKWPDKDPQAVKDYALDWSALLASGETLATSNWAVTPTGELAIGLKPIIGNLATVWLSGGVDGTAYSLVNTITTSRGVTDERTVQIKVKGQ